MIREIKWEEIYSISRDKVSKKLLWKHFRRRNVEVFDVTLRGILTTELKILSNIDGCKKRSIFLTECLKDSQNLKLNIILVLK